VNFSFQSPNFLYSKERKKQMELQIGKTYKLDPSHKRTCFLFFAPTSKNDPGARMLGKKETLLCIETDFSHPQDSGLIALFLDEDKDLVLLHDYDIEILMEA